MFFKKFSDFIIKYKFILLAVFAIILVFSIIGTVYLVNDDDKINSDMMTYLTDDFDTAQGLDFIQDNFGIRGNVMIVIRGTEDDSELEDSISSIKTEYSDVLSQFIWVEDVEKLEEIKDQLEDIDLDAIPDIEDEDLLEILNSDDISELISNANYYPDLLEALSMEVDTSELSSYLKRDIGDGYFDYVILIMTNDAPSSADSYELLDNIKAELLSTTIIIDGEETVRPMAASGTTESSQVITEDIYGDLPNFLMYAIFAVIIILLLTSASFIEPIILAVTLGISILISMGVNYLYPSISIISFATSSILQLAITMDYAIFYMHTYKLNRKKLSAVDATRSSIPQVAPSIIASGLTTIGGFAALYCMRFGIGADIANVIIKGIVLSLISVIVLQPIFTLLLDKLILKTTHNFTEKLNKKIISRNSKSEGINKSLLVKPIAKFSVWQRIVLIVIAVALLVPSYIGQSNITYNYFHLYDTEATTIEEITATNLSNQTIIAVPLETKDGYTQQDFIDMIKAAPNDKVSGVISAFTSIKNIDSDSMIAVLEIMNDEDGVSSMQTLIESLADSDSTMYSYIDSYLQDNYDRSLEEFDLDQYNLGDVDLEDMLDDFDPTILNSYFAKVNNTWYTLYSVSIDGSTEDAEAAECYEYLKTSMVTVFGNNCTYSIGNLTASYDLMTTTPTDFLVVTLVSVGIILLLLSILLRNPLKSLILVIMIELGIWINLSFTYLLGDQINFMIYIAISSIQLGCTVDYAILLANTFEKNRDKYTSGKECAINSAIQSVPAIFTSAIIIITVCLSVYFVSENLIIKQLTGMLARGAAISFVLVTFVQTAIMSFYKTERKMVDYEGKLRELEKVVVDNKKPSK
jgi:predicted RND superfamily exporter protein